MPQLFEDRFPEQKALWNEYGLNLQWYKIVRQALRHLKTQVNKNNIKLFPLPRLDKRFSDCIVKSVRHKSLQLRLVCIEDENVRQKFINETIDMITNAR
jgi:hypothetical protein